MKIKILSWIFTLTMVLSLAACTLPEMTPPATELVPSATSNIQVPPPEPSETATQIKPAVKINDSNVKNLTLVNKAAVSNAQQITWAEDGKSLSVSTQNSDANGNQVYGVTTLKVSDLSPLAVFSSQEDRQAAIAQDGHTVAVVSQDMKSFKLVDLAAENAVIFSLTPGYMIGDITFSPNLQYFSVQSMDAWEVTLYDFKSHQEVKKLTGFETAAPVYNAGFANSPQWMVWHARAMIQLQEVETGTMGAQFSHQDFVSAYTMSPDGTLLASSASPSVEIWDAETGAKIKTLEINNPANSLDFSPDGKLLAVATGNEVQIWDPAKGSLLTTLTGHTDTVTRATFSPDQKFIATAGMDNQLYLWQISE